jgi:hypothetical protein
MIMIRYDSYMTHESRAAVDGITSMHMSTISAYAISKHIPFSHSIDLSASVGTLLEQLLFGWSEGNLSL